MTATDGIEESYTDAFGEERSVSRAVRDAVVAAMGRVDGGSEALVAPPGTPLPHRGELTFEDGTSIGPVAAVPRDAPLGYHRLHSADGSERLVITGPGRCHLPTDVRAWGWAIQLAATRSSRSWGIGDLADLADLAEWSAARGAGFMAVSPLGAPNPGPTPEASPYYPSTRRFGNPLHVAVEAIGGPDLADLAMRARALNDDRTIDREAALALKLEALARLWDARRFDQEAFDAWRAARGEALERWAIFCTLTERLGPGWQSWPEPYRSPDSADVAREAKHRRDRVAFHAWVQWCFDRQLEKASAAVRRIADMPVGVDPGGFDAWDWQGELALDASIGAPPDRFNSAGQDWGLPPFVPARLRDAGYRPFIETIRAQLRHAGGLRIDHALALFRLWWIPRGNGPADGAYVRYPTRELLEIVALESHRAKAIVVGEDLGTVPAGVRAELRRRRLLSTRLALFETRPPDRWPRRSFAAVTTHDLPTIAGIWGGRDIEDQAEAGIDADASSNDLLRRRLAKAAGVHVDVPAERAIDALHRRLAAAPPMLVAATLEDAVGVEERPNLPGTVSEQRANWSIALPVPLEKLQDDPRVRRLTEALRR